jgi:hypothetical protein
LKPTIIRDSRSRFLDADSDAGAERALAEIFDAATERWLVDAVGRGLLGAARRQSDAEGIASDTRERRSLSRVQSSIAAS